MQVVEHHDAEHIYTRLTQERRANVASVELCVPLTGAYPEIWIGGGVKGSRPFPYTRLPSPSCRLPFPSRPPPLPLEVLAPLIQLGGLGAL